ncbi:MAG: hypothetical protein WC144_04385 [Sulfurimonas sp.]|jgi:hypothetical protein|nr:hypothetical protein [Sulfurimonadaceae bacterium]
MKNLVLIIALAIGAMAMDNVVTYGTNTTEGSAIQTNHPTQELY